MKKVLWQELRRTEFDEAIKSNGIVIIPIASTEQHGDHLPVSTDANQCLNIAQRAAQAVDEFPVLVLPVVWTGYSGEHISYPGTITLKYNTFIEVLTDIVICIDTHGFRKILLLNGHGSNEFIIAGLLGKLAHEDHITGIVACTWWQIPRVAKEMNLLTELDNGSIGHAGEVETSIQRYLQPELVDMSVARWAQGIVGNPHVGTAEKGERLVRVAVDALVEILREYHSGKLASSLNRVFKKDVFVGSKNTLKKESWLYANGITWEFSSEP
jgi:creatinine amidohydrolase